MPISETQFNGNRASAEDLAPLAFAGYAHFTAMQVRDRAVRGLDLHLARLRAASEQLFGRSVPDDRIRDLLCSATADTPADLSLTCHVSARPGEFNRASTDTELDVLVRITDPVTPAPDPVTLAALPHQRHLPQLKHVGEVAKTELLRRANAAGFDDAVFVDHSGRISEATIWNIAFWDGTSVIWPQADLLDGITQQILRRRLSAQGIPQTTRPVRAMDLDDRFAAALMNSWSPGIPVSRIADRPLGDHTDLIGLLHRAYATEPPVPLCDPSKSQ
ncbi:branched-chain amino acid aminotransferase [Enemella evansiae]|uniref:aminotransferase class IV family protein n=1 Tax=Enemella evansiae TaxID=2016499 RepID=UPI000B95E853|nr:aminotransferase class IV family protein [Enemella evansiae]OYO13908.1 branched-chain amino acid aminotransferase [Enemella evansiae]